MSNWAKSCCCAAQKHIPCWPPPFFVLLNCDQSSKFRAVQFCHVGKTSDSKCAAMFGPHSGYESHHSDDSFASKMYWILVTCHPLSTGHPLSSLLLSLSSVPQIQRPAEANEKELLTAAVSSDDFHFKLTFWYWTSMNSFDPYFTRSATYDILFLSKVTWEEQYHCCICLFTLA